MTILHNDQSVDAFWDITDTYFKIINNNPIHTNTTLELYMFFIIIISLRRVSVVHSTSIRYRYKYTKVQSAIEDASPSHSS